MKVSVIIPARNEERYIARTIRAVLAQRYPHLEVIVVDNGSTDRTMDIVRQFPQVRLVSEPRPGVQFARECGRRQATGDIIANLDADNLPGPEWVSRAVAYFADPKVVGMSGPYDLYDAPFLIRMVHLFTQKIIFPVLTTVLYTLFGRGVIAIGGNMFSRATALETIGGYNTAIRFYGDDIDTANRLARVGKFLFRDAIAVRASARRYQRSGYLRQQWLYTLNYLWVVLLGHPYRNEFGA